jgi:TM2 domain-containing membrane protein YozV
MSGLDVSELLLVEARVADRGPKTGVAYLCWFLGGLIGVHRFYLGRRGSGVLMLFTFGLAGFMTFFDLFLIPGMAREARERIRREETLLAVAGRAPPPEPVYQPGPSIDADLIGQLLRKGTP